MKKWLIITGACILVLALLAASGWLWLTRSESGARWALARGAGAVEQLEYEALTGGLASGVTIEGLRFAQAGSRVTAERIELAVRVELFGGPRVVVRHLRADDIDIHPPDEPGETDPQPQSQPFDLSGLASPVAVVVDELDLRKLRLHSGEQPLVIEHIRMAGRYQDQVVIDDLSVGALGARAQLDGRWPLDNARSGRLALTAEVGVGTDSRQSATLTLTGSLGALRFDVSGEGPATLEGEGAIDGLPGAPELDAGIRGGITGWPGLPVEFEDLALTLRGSPTDWRAEVDTGIRGGGMPPGRWSLAASGGLDSLVVESLSAEVLDGRIDGDGELAWGEATPSARARVELENLDLTSLYPEWPNQGRVSGELIAATNDGVIEVERLDMTARPGELSVTGDGRIDPSADRLDIALDWRNFAWPPVSDGSEPLVASESGRLQLEGKISDWRGQLDALLDSPDMPSARIEARAAGSRERATIERLRIDAGAGGELSVDGSLAWDPTLEAGLNLAVNDFDPGVALRQLPGRISGRMRLDLARGEAWRTEITVDELTGELRGQPLSADGQLAMLDAQPQTGDITLALGDNRIVIARNNDDWQVDLAAGALGQLWPDLAGQAEITGRVSPAQGELALEGHIATTQYDNYHLERAEIALSLNWLDEPAIDLALNASNLDVRPWDRLERLELTLDGNCDSHRLGLHTEGSRGRIDLAGSGRLDGCLDDFKTWQGQLDRLYLGETPAGDWRLAEPLSLTIDAAGAQAGPACLTTAADTDSRLCLESLDAGAEGRVVAAIDEVPMDLLLLPLDPLLSLTTPLSGRIEADWSPAGLTALAGYLELAPGILRAVGDERDLLQVDSLRVELSPEQTAGLMVDLHARVEGQTEINGRARMADLRNPMDTRLEGEARIDLPDIGAFSHLLPRLDRIGGRANGRLEVVGPVSGPNLSGRLALSDGEIVHAPLGLEIRDIGLKLEGDSNRATLNGRAQSGEGRLELAGEGRLSEDGWQVEARVDGDRFAFAGVDWLQLTASPQLAVTARPEQVEIDGDIVVDRLRAGLPPGSASRIDPAPDVEVRGETPEEEQPRAEPARRIEGRLGIELGDDARLAAAGLDTRLAGGIDLRWSGDPEPKGRGTIRLPEGAYRAYGQNLEISDGEIVFTGHPLDAPRLDIRAVRDIFGDPEVDAAGVRIRGSARNPAIDLYTDPPTSEEKALAYVVTGADFDHAGGQGALNVGFYLLPRLFVSYGVGLFEAGNVLSGRYELSRRWGVRVVSGERDTGVDMSYSVSN